MYNVKLNAKQRKGLNSTMYLVKQNDWCRWFMESDRRIIFTYSFYYWLGMGTGQCFPLFPSMHNKAGLYIYLNNKH